MDKTLDNKLGLVQFIDWEDEEIKELGAASHTFLAARDEKGRFVCFEKVGTGLYPFQINSLEKIYELDQGSRKPIRWAAAPVEDLDKVREVREPK